MGPVLEASGPGPLDRGPGQPCPGLDTRTSLWGLVWTQAWKVQDRTPDNLAVMRHNTDRPNIFLVVERMKHPANSYEDLAFVIKKNFKLGPGDKCPPKFLVFFNSRGEAQAGAKFLRARLSPELCDKVIWFHSGMTDQFREDEMHALIIVELFSKGSTDAAGMVSLTALKVEIIITGLLINRESISLILNGLFNTELQNSLAHFGREQVVRP